MRPDVLLHVAAGAVAIGAGFAALAAAKGGRVHRSRGRLFAASMLVMATTGFVMSIPLAEVTNLLAAGLAIYLVTTGWATMRPWPDAYRRADAALAVFGLGLALGALALAAPGLARGQVVHDGVPVPVVMMFGVVALLGVIGDVRRMRSGPARGAARLRRHLWRMSFALFIASASFFLGQADELPASMRVMPLLAVPALAPLAALVFGLWRGRLHAAPRPLGLERP